MRRWTAAEDKRSTSGWSPVRLSSLPSCCFSRRLVRHRAPLRTRWTSLRRRRVDERAFGAPEAIEVSGSSHQPIKRPPWWWRFVDLRSRPFASPGESDRPVHVRSESRPTTSWHFKSETVWRPGLLWRRAAACAYPLLSRGGRLPLTAWSALRERGGTSDTRHSGIR